MFPRPADGHVHGYDASGRGEAGQELPAAPGRRLHRLGRETSREGGAEGAAHVRGREEVRRQQQRLNYESEC